jgi:hypothetical protein
MPGCVVNSHELEVNEANSVSSMTWDFQ